MKQRIIFHNSCKALANYHCITGCDQPADMLKAMQVIAVLQCILTLFILHLLLEDRRQITRSTHVHSVVCRMTELKLSAVYA